jgi:hypothetical protein
MPPQLGRMVGRMVDRCMMNACDDGVQGPPYGEKSG